MFILGTTENNSNTQQAPILLIQFDETFYHETSSSFFSDKQRVVPITMVGAKLPYGSITRRQFPISLAYASTIHSAQGATCDYVVLGLSGTFERGLPYVGLSRVREFSHLALYDGRFTLADINNRTNNQIQTNMTKLMAEVRRLEHLDQHPPLFV